MSVPRDTHRADRIGMVRLARIFSNVVSPPVMFAIIGFVFAWHELPFWPGLAWAVTYGLLVSLLPILFIFYLLKTGHIAELHMSNTNERHLPYVSAVFATLIALGLVSYLQGPELLRCLTLFNLIELVALGIINIFWLISLHATGIMATMVLVGLVFGWQISFVAVFPFVILVCAVRLYLKRHTPAQVVAGLALGAGSVLSLTWVGCFG